MKLCKTNRFHFAVGLYTDNAQKMSKHGKTIKMFHNSLLNKVLKDIQLNKLQQALVKG